MSKKFKYLLDGHGKHPHSAIVFPRNHQYPKALYPSQEHHLSECRLEIKRARADGSRGCEKRTGYRTGNVVGLRLGVDCAPSPRDKRCGELRTSRER